MEITIKLLGYFFIIVFPLILVKVIEALGVPMPSFVDWFYKCPIGNDQCASALNWINFGIAYILFAVLIGIAWEIIKRVFIKQKIPTIHCWTETPGLQKVFVKIDNQTRSDFVDPRVELKIFNRIEPPNHKSAITEMGTSNVRFSKTPSGRLLTTIPKGSYDLVAIAEIRNHELWYRLDQEYNEQKTYSLPTKEGYTGFSNQDLELEISGTMNGELRKIPFKGRIKFDRIFVRDASAKFFDSKVSMGEMPIAKLDRSTLVWNEGIRNDPK